MRGAGNGLLVIGIIIAILGLVNHYIIKANPIAHFSTIVVGAGVVVALIGLVVLVMSVMGGRKAA